MQTRRYVTLGLEPLAQWSLVSLDDDKDTHSPRPLHPVLPPPSGLFITHHPRELFIRGRPEAFDLLRALPDYGFAVVGTRRPQARSLQLLRSRIRALEGGQLVILSGLALGVDAAAHEAALAVGLPTIAILGSPLDQIYPPQNRALANQILEQGGLLVSELAPGSDIRPHFFLLRNRLIAGWSKATWIVEASERSGALNTATWAFELDRETFATPSFPGDPSFVGNLELFERHKASPFWRLSALDEIWPHLPSLRHPRRIHPLPPLWAIPQRTEYNGGSGQDDALHLTIEVLRATVQEGGVSVEGLLQRSLALNWNPQRFFEALQLCLDERRIKDRGGILSAIRADSP